MIRLKCLLKKLGIYIILLVLIVFICSLLNLIGVNSTITNLILFLFNIVLFIVYGFKNGIKSKEKGYLSGLKIGLIMILILFIVNLIVARIIFSLPLFVYYLTLLLSSTFGGMVGISKKKEEN